MKAYKLYQYLIYVYMIIYMIPTINLHVPTIIKFSFLLLIYFSLFCFNTNNVKKLFVFLLSFFSIDLLFFLYNFLQTSEPILPKVYGILQVLVLPLIVLNVLKKDDIDFANKLIKEFFILSSITAVTTIIGLHSYPMASRELATGIAADNPQLYYVYTSANIGGFGFIYELVILIPIIFLSLRHNILSTLFSVLLIVLFALAIISSQYTMALLLLFICIGFSFGFKTITKKKFWKFLFITFILIFILRAIIPSLLYFIIDLNIINSEGVVLRLMDLASLLNGDLLGYDSDIYLRNLAYFNSWKAFVDSPLIGTIFSSASSYKLGGHSFLLDNLARFGILFFVLYILTCRNIYKHCYYNYRNRAWFGYVLFVMFIVVLLSVLNTQFNQRVLLLLLPLVCYVIGFNSKKI